MMFCVNCGSSMEAEHRFCGTCGAAVGGTGPVAARTARPATPALEKHLPILGTLWILRGGLRLIGAAWLYFVGAAMLPWIAGFSHGRIDTFLGGFIPGLLRFGAWATALVAIASIAAGYGLLQREKWARPLALVMGFLALLSVPLGTALGIYTLWVLLPAGSESEYRRLAQAT